MTRKLLLGDAMMVAGAMIGERIMLTPAADGTISRQQFSRVEGERFPVPPVEPEEVTNADRARMARAEAKRERRQARNISAQKSQLANLRKNAN